MYQILKPKQIVNIQPLGSECEVEELLGSGGQGEVYRVNLSGSKLALKWYYPHQATSEQKEALEKIIKIGIPNKCFLWPMDITTAKDTPGFGYIMPLREPRYKNIVDLLKRRADPTFRTLAVACRDLSHSYLQLHSKGLCYRDISFGNVFFDPQSGEILICDNDNVAVNKLTKSGVLGTPKFMAPEIVRGEADPSTQTDLYSLAVLMFYMLMVHHPLDGKKALSIKCMDLPAMEKLYGKEPLFIFDPFDRSNEPDIVEQLNAIDYWKMYPQFLKLLFIKAFTDGLKDPDRRVRESEWREAMERLQDSIFYCSCSLENFYDPDSLKALGGKPGTCWSCNKELQLSPRMRIGKNNIVMLNLDTKLYPHHIDNMQTHNFTAPVGEISRNPNNPNIWGLKNLSKTKWVITTADGTVKDIEPQRSLTLADGTKINFGNTEGEIRK